MTINTPKVVDKAQYDAVVHENNRLRVANVKYAEQASHHADRLKAMRDQLELLRLSYGNLHAQHLTLQAQHGAPPLEMAGEVEKPSEG